MKYNQCISLVLLALSGVFLLCTVFATDLSLENGLVSGKVHWFHLAVLFMNVCCLIVGILVKPAKRFMFSPLDVLILLIVANLMLTYNWQLNPEPEKILFGGQLVVLWFLLRFIFGGWPQLKLFFLTVIIGTGLVEAISGIRQLHGFEGSNHSLFRLTGDFYNPGPYSGYLALILPVCLWMILQFSDCKKVGLRQTKIYQYYFAWVTLLVIIVVLPAGMSRAAWIAATISCGWVYWELRIGWEKTRLFINEHRILSGVFSIIVLLVLTAILSVAYGLKKDSANGRLLLWKVTGQAIMEQPWSGTGLGGFPAAYAEEQAEYFVSGKASESEMMVAGCPDYGFNEFLQIGLEQGVIGLILFILLLCYSLFRGVKNRQVGAAGGILALMVFCLASYPLQLPEFWVVLVVFMSMINTSVATDVHLAYLQKKGKIGSVIMVGILMVCCGEIFYQQKGYYQGYKQWNMLKRLNNNKAYDVANNGYEELVLLMKHRPELLFESALCLNRKERYIEANELLYRAMRLSCDPMIHYVAAKNEHLLGNYQKAENILLHAIEMLPERIYPYYLLVQLYSDPAFFQEDKFLKAVDGVMKKEPKVESTAIREMRTEVQKLLNSRRSNRN